MLRYVFEEEDVQRPEDPYSKAHERVDPEEICAHLREQTVGNELLIRTPFGKRFMTYADYTASGRALRPIEEYIQRYVLASYGNTHTMTSYTGRQTTFFRNEARNIIKNCLNATHEDAAIFCGAGVTGAVHKFVDILKQSKFQVDDLSEDAVKDSYFKEDRWGGCECTLCGIKCKNEQVYRGHIHSEIHQANVQKRLEQAGDLSSKKRSGVRRVVFVLDPTAHHSTLLPFKELTKKYPLRSGKILYASESVSADNHVNQRSSSLESRDVEVEAVTVNFSQKTGAMCEDNLREILSKVSIASMQCKDNDSVVLIAILSAGSNVSGIKSDLNNLTKLVHQHKGIVAWDFAAAGSHGFVDLNPPSDALAKIDVAFFSPHKMLGGPGTTGLLIAKKKVLTNAIPSVPGGGVVFYVSNESHSYIQNYEDREEAGTPSIVDCVRTGLVFHFQSQLPKTVFHRETEMVRYLAKNWNKHERIELCGNLQFCGQSDRYDEHNQMAIMSFMIRYGNKDGSNKGGLFLHYNFVAAVLNDLFGVQNRAGCACAGPYAQYLLGMDQKMSDRFEDCLQCTGHEVLRPGFVRLGPHFSMNQQDLDILLHSVQWVADNAWRLLPAYDFKLETGEWHHRLDSPQKHRRWLSSLPIIGRGVESDLKVLEDDLAADAGVNVPKTAEELVISANKQIEEQFSTSMITLKDARRGALLLNDERSRSLLWFALPSDAAFSLENNSSSTQNPNDMTPLLDTDPMPGVEFDRPTSAIFSVRQFTSITTSSSVDIDEKNNDNKCCVTSETKTKEDEVEETPIDDFLADIMDLDVSDPEEENIDEENSKQKKKKLPYLFNGVVLKPQVPKQLRGLVGAAIRDFGMINEGDTVLVGLSGGKDSLTLLHILLELQKRSETKFEIAAATVDPMTPEYRPQPLIEYMKVLGVKYHMLSKPLIQMAKCHLDPKKPSICAFCSRMKRGMLYSCMRENGYTSLALGQHLDDLAESFVMSAFLNGNLRTMKANYFVEAGDIRVIRPLVYVREKALSKFAVDSNLPIIADNCPACFKAPQERHRTKLFLSQQEFENPNLFSSLLKCMTPLISIGNADKSKDWHRQGVTNGNGNSNNNEGVDAEGSGDLIAEKQELNPIGRCGLRRGDADDLDFEDDLPDEGPTACQLNGLCPLPAAENANSNQCGLNTNCDQMDNNNSCASICRPNDDDKENDHLPLADSMMLQGLDDDDRKKLTAAHRTQSMSI